jgi:DNA-binding NtrC family response regulator
MPTALLVEDDASTLAGLTAFVEEQGFSTTTATSVAEGRAALNSGAFDVVLIDGGSPAVPGVDVLADLPEDRRPEVVLMGDALATDGTLPQEVHFLRKPVDRAKLADILGGIRRRSRSPATAARARSGVGRLLGTSGAIARVRELVAKVAPTELSVYIEGESGTGKELVAHALHDASRRAEAPFLALNCGALPETLIDSELFGHERGAFTGAVAQKPGVFEQASGGTLFLDEVTEMPTDLQVRLLRSLETGTVRRVGGAADITVDVRVVAATNRSFDRAIRDGKLREDLFHRLCVFPIAIPALRERREDIPLLAQQFLADLAAANGKEKWLHGSAIEAMTAYSWPGNVRQLRNVIQQAYVIADDVVTADCLPPQVRGVLDAVHAPAAGGAGGDTLCLDVGMTIAEAERRLIEATLRKFGGQKQAAAEALGVSVRTLYYRLNQYAQRDHRGTVRGKGDGREAQAAPG